MRHRPQFVNGVFEIWSLPQEFLFPLKDFAVSNELNGNATSTNKIAFCRAGCLGNGSRCLAQTGGGKAGLTKGELPWPPSRPSTSNWQSSNGP
jgi:hypothetical protein